MKYEQEINEQPLNKLNILKQIKIDLQNKQSFINQNSFIHPHSDRFLLQSSTIEVKQHNDMSIRFRPLHDVLKDSNLLIKKQEQQCVFIFLVDLRPQQLPIVGKQFQNSFQFQSRRQDVNDDNQKGNNDIQNQQQKDNKRQQTDRVYSNVQSMLWVSDAVYRFDDIQQEQEKIKQTEGIVTMNQNNNQDNKHHNNKKKQLSIRYLYLPPLSEYFNHLNNKINQLNRLKQQQKTQKQTYITTNINTNKQQPYQQPLPIKLQLQLQQQHKLLYTLGRCMSSSVVYDFTSKYIRYYHLQLLKDDHGCLNELWNQQKQQRKRRNYIKQWEMYLSRQRVSDSIGNKEVPYYVVIKTIQSKQEHQKQQQHSYQTHRVKLIPNTTTFQSNLKTPTAISNNRINNNTNTNTNNSLRMQIDSKKVISTQYLKQLKYKINQSKEQNIIVSNKVNAEIVIKLLNVQKEGCQKQQSQLQRQNQQQIYLQLFTKKDNIKIVEFRLLCRLMISNCLQTDKNNNFQMNYNQKKKFKLKAKDLQKIAIQYLFQKTLQEKIKKLIKQILTKNINKNCIVNNKQILQLINKLFSFSHYGLSIINNNNYNYRQQHQEKMINNILMNLHYDNDIIGVDEQQIKQVDKQQMELSFFNFQLVEYIVNKHIIQFFAIDAFQHQQQRQQHKLLSIIQNNTSLVSVIDKQRQSIKQFIQQSYCSSNRNNRCSSIQSDLISNVTNKLRQYKQQHITSMLYNEKKKFKSFDCINNNGQNCYHQHIIQRQQKQNAIDNNNSMKQFKQMLKTIQIESINITNPQTYKVYKHLLQKLRFHQILLMNSQLLALLYSLPQQINALNDRINKQSNMIEQLNSHIIQLQQQSTQHNQTIYQQQQQIIKHKEQQQFHHQVLAQLNIIQYKYIHQQQETKKLSVQLQCTRIQNIQLKQLVQSYKYRQLRLLEEKSNFLQAISNLSKDNLEYINQLGQKNKQIQRLNKLVQGYQSISVRITQLQVSNHQLSKQKQSLVKWRQTIQQYHKQLIQKQINKFNFVLQLNYKEYQQYVKENKLMKTVIDELRDRVKQKDSRINQLQDELQIIKSRYYKQKYYQTTAEQHEQQQKMKINNKEQINYFYSNTKYNYQFNEQQQQQQKQQQQLYQIY